MTTTTIKRTVSERVFRVTVPAELDPDTDEVLVSNRFMVAAEFAIASALAVEGPVDGESFRYMRGVLGLEARRIAELLGVRAETISRWETGKTDVDRAAWLTLGTMVLERAGRTDPVLDRMTRIAKGRPPSKRVSLHLPA